jgi:hypothetical protein
VACHPATDRRSRRPRVTDHAVDAYRQRVRECSKADARKHIQRIVIEGGQLRSPPPWMVGWSPARTSYYALPAEDLVAVVRRWRVVTVLVPLTPGELVERLAEAWGARLTVAG